MVSSSGCADTTNARITRLPRKRMGLLERVEAGVHRGLDGGAGAALQPVQHAAVARAHGVLLGLGQRLPGVKLHHRGVAARTPDELVGGARWVDDPAFALPVEEQ